MIGVPLDKVHRRCHALQWGVGIEVECVCCRALSGVAAAVTNVILAELECVHCTRAAGAAVGECCASAPPDWSNNTLRGRAACVDTLVAARQAARAHVRYGKAARRSCHGCGLLNAPPILPARRWMRSTGGVPACTWEGVAAACRCGVYRLSATGTTSCRAVAVGPLPARSTPKQRLHATSTCRHAHAWRTHGALPTSSDTPRRRGYTHMCA